MRLLSRRNFLAGSLMLPMAVGRLHAEPIDKEYEELIEKGLAWVKRNQSRDGHWEAPGGQYPVTMTALSGMALLGEGSTLREGRFKDNLRRATDWLMAQAVQRREGGTMLVNPNMPGESGRYMYGHGFALLFLSSVYGEEEEGERREKLEKLLVEAAKFTFYAQTERKWTLQGKQVTVGGWGYVSAKDGNNFDEGSVTITQVQALRAARNAGIEVPRESITRAVNYLEASTGPSGGVVYSLAGGGGGDGRPALTAAGICCGFSAGEYNSPLVKKWFKFCKQRVPMLGTGRFGHDEYTHYYYAQAMYMLGDDGWAKLFPDDPPDAQMTWSKYRKDTFDFLKRTQQSDGSWTGGHVGPVFITAVHLTMLQLDKAALPIYQR